MATVLGLDIGANSVGWSLMDLDDGKVIATGVRIFSAGVENFDTAKEASRCENRRVKRGARHTQARRARRKKQLRALLTEVGLLPIEPAAIEQLMRTDPYQLRHRALTESLSPHEIGRILLHFAQRRGFLSNRKTDAGSKKEAEGMLAEISQLEKEIQNGDGRTLGGYLHLLKQQDSSIRLRNRHTRRSMYIEEFQRIWSSQQKHHPDVMTDELREKIRQILFFQRKMYWAVSSIGRCELEPAELRCPRGDRLAQLFRMLQELNNLKYSDPETGEEFRLTESPELYGKLIEEMKKKKTITFDQIRKLFNFPETIRFNLEEGDRKSIKGLEVDAQMACKKIFGPAWWKMPIEQRDEIVRYMIEGTGRSENGRVIDRDDEEIRRRAREDWGLSKEAAEELLKVKYPAGHVRYSRKALEKIVPELRRGLLLMTDDNTESALSAAGYLRPDQRQRNLSDRLPAPPDDITNPVVIRALHEVKTVVNAILREYGRPDRIHIELARDAKATGAQRSEMSKKMRQRQREREDAAQVVVERGHEPTRSAVNRYLLWTEQGGVCPYSGTEITLSQLFGGEVDIDHILPRSRTLDDSMMNKVVCMRADNDDKSNRTPYEWLAESDPQRYEQMIQRVRNLPYPKRQRFSRQTLELDDFITRQLNDTRYISRVVAGYVDCLFEKPGNVLCIRGDQTALLRRLWGLNTVIETDVAPPTKDATQGEKNRSDHRHHAVDATVVALVDRGTLQRLSQARRYDSDQERGLLFPPPWEGFRADVVEAIAGINVSHRVNRRVRGALHEESNYGPTPGEKPETVSEEIFVVRKPLASLTGGDILSIRDPRIRQLALERLASVGIVPNEKGKLKCTSKQIADAFAQPLLLPPSKKNADAQPTPIRKVRILKKDKTIRPLRMGEENGLYVKPGSNHHLAIFEWEENGKTKRESVFVSLLEARQRLASQQRLVRAAERELREQGLSNSQRRERMKEIRRCIVTEQCPLINRVHPDRTDARFVMSLSRGEMVLLNFKGEDRLVVFRTAASTQGQIYFADHRDSKPDYDKMVVMAGTLRGRKVTVDPLGRIRDAND